MYLENGIIFHLRFCIYSTLCLCRCQHIFFAFEKFFIKRIPPVDATNNIIAFIPIMSEQKKSKSNPKAEQINGVYNLLKNSPRNKASTINKFGFTPAIVKTPNTFDCKKYKQKNIIKIVIIANAFFTQVSFTLF